LDLGAEFVTDGVLLLMCGGVYSRRVSLRLLEDTWCAPNENRAD